MGVFLLGEVMKRKPIVGETLFSLNIGNAARRGTPQILTPVIVTKVGNKYFFAGRTANFQRQYHLDTWLEKSDFCADSKLYASEQEWEDEKEQAELCNTIEGWFKYGNLMNVKLDVLREFVKKVKTP